VSVSVIEAAKRKIAQLATQLSVRSNQIIDAALSIYKLAVRTRTRTHTHTHTKRLLSIERVSSHGAATATAIQLANSFVQGRPSEHVIAACLYIVLRQERMPRTCHAIEAR